MAMPVLTSLLHPTQGITQDALPKDQATSSGHGFPLNTVIKIMVSRHASCLLDSAKLMINTVSPARGAELSSFLRMTLGPSWSWEGTVMWRPCPLY